MTSEGSYWRNARTDEGRLMQRSLLRRDTLSRNAMGNLKQHTFLAPHLGEQLLPSTTAVGM